MFSFGLVASSNAISGLSEGMDTFQMILDFVNIIILFVICFLINYTTKFMFTKRSREFGMYLLLGIRRGKVIRMFLLEILLLGLFPLALSFPAGFMISQVISMIIVGAFGIPEVIFITFDHASAGMLILYFAGVCLLVLLNTGRKMRRISIRGFLDMEKENEKKMLRSAGRRNLFFCISILLGVLGFLVWNSQFDTNVNSDQSVMYWLMFGIVLFHMQSLPFAVLWGGAVRSRDADKCAARRNKSFRGYGYYNNGSEGDYTYSFESICFESRRGKRNLRLYFLGKSV